jgi:zinc and cadmium transporter
LTLHALVDGLALAAAVEAESADHAVALAGLGTCLAVALHKPFDSLTIGTLLAAEGRSKRLRYAVNAAYALVTPLGAALFYVVSSGGRSGGFGVGETLGFACGAFLCIATSDLLPELQFHHHDRGKLSAALAAGLVLAWATVLAEGGHDHRHGTPSHGQAHDAEHAHDHADGHEAGQPHNH